MLGLIVIGRGLDKMSTQKTQRLLGDVPLIYIGIEQLYEMKNLHYQPFLSEVINQVNQIVDEEHMLTHQFFEKVETHDNEIVVIIPLDDGEVRKVTLHSQKKHGFTKGELVYALAQCLPQQEWGDHHIFVGLQFHRDGYWLDLE